MIFFQLWTQAKCTSLAIKNRKKYKDRKNNGIKLSNRFTALSEDEDEDNSSATFIEGKTSKSISISAKKELEVSQLWKRGNMKVFDNILLNQSAILIVT